MKQVAIFFLACLLGLAGCENTDVQLVAEAGLEAVKAITLTDEEIQSLVFLQNKGYDPAGAVSALRKLATLGNDHSLLSNHPAPGKRADRLEGKPDEPGKSPEDRLTTVISSLKERFAALYEKVRQFL